MSGGSPEGGPPLHVEADVPDSAPRIAGLDVLRGIAILAILFMNINHMGASNYASLFDPRQIGWSQADQTVWWLREVIVDGTARGLLEMLFGVGMVILTDRAAAGAGERAVWRRYRTRNIVLLAFGLVHVLVLLWPGDILHTYALAALIVFWFRRLSARKLLGFGLVMAALQLVGGGFGYHAEAGKAAAIRSAQQEQAAGRPLDKAATEALGEAAERRREQVAERRAHVANVTSENAARTGDFRSWASAAWSDSWYLFSHGLEVLFVWEAASTMLIGAALYRWGVIQGARSRSFYLGLTLTCYAIGLGARAIGATGEIVAPDAPSIMWSLDEPARLLTTLGHIGLAHLLLGTPWGRRMLRPFEAAGRTALSIYIAQTLIGMWVLYPPFMLGFYGRQDWVGLMVTALAINAVLLVLANLWMRRFAIAPVEWAWRSLAEGRRLPFGRRPQPAAEAPPPT